MGRGKCLKWKLAPPAPHSLATLARLGANDVLYGLYFVFSPLRTELHRGLDKLITLR
jgi:hypothetical protein